VLFLMGLEHAIFPVGRTMAAQFAAPDFLAEGGDGEQAAVDPLAYFWVYAFGFAIGFSTTIAEPALIAVALKAEELSAGAIDAWGLRVTPEGLHHPQGAMAYRIDGPERSIVIATDHEAGSAADADLLELARGADVLIHDSQYTPEEYASRKVGWGHSTWEDAAAVAEAAGVGQLVLTSHDPDRTDEEVDGIVTKARERFPNTEGAWEGLTLPL